MRKSDEIRAEVETLKDEVAEIVELATAETRELTAEEKKRVDEIQGNGRVTGLLATLSADLERAIKFEARLLEKSNELSATLGGGNGQDPKRKKCEIFAKGESITSRTKPPVPHALAHCIRASVLGRNHPSIPRELRNSLTEGSNEKGGYLVPSELSSEVFDLMRAKSVVMQAGAQMAVMNAPSTVFAIVTGDPTFAVRQELETITLSDITMTAAELVAVSVGARVKLSRELVEDAANVIPALESYLQDSLAAQVDYYAINGHTNTKPMGLLQNPSISSTGSIGAIDWQDLAAATTTLRTANHEPNSFVMAPSIHDALFNTETGDGTNSARGWLDAPPTIREKQFFHTTNCPTTSIIAGDFTNLIWGVRGKTIIEATTEGDDAFSTHSVYVKIVWRGDFVCVRPAGFHILTGVTAS